MKHKFILMLFCSLCSTAICYAHSWPTKPLGGQEKLIYGEERFLEIREKIDNNLWAAELYQKLQDGIESSLNDENLAENTIAKGLEPLMALSPVYRDIALYYRISGDEKYLPVVVDALKEYFSLEVYNTELFPNKEATNTDLWIWLMMRTGLFQAYDLLKTHPLVAPFVPAMNLRLEEIIGETKRYTTYMRHAGNTQFWTVTMGLGVAAMLSDDIETFKDVLYNDYYGAEAILSSFKDGGVSRAEPVSYYYGYVTCCLTILFEIARYNDVDDMYHYTSANGNTFEKILEGFMEVSKPNGSLICNGDGGEYIEIIDGAVLTTVNKIFGDESVPKSMDKWEIYNRVYDNPNIAWIISQNPSRDGYCDRFWGYSALTYGVTEPKVAAAPNARSVVRHEVGDVLLKSVEGPDYWLSDAITVHVRAGKTLINHNNSDHLHIKLDAFGKSIYTDWYHRYDYIAPRARNNYADQTPFSPRVLSHNTVAVDFKEPENHNITFSEVDHSSPGAQIFEAKGTPYNGVESSRVVCLTQEYLLDIFSLSSDTSHTYDFVLNSLGTVSSEGAAESFEYKTINEDYGLAPIDKWSKRERNVWIADARRAKVEADNLVVTFRDSDGIGATATTLCEEPTELITAGTPYYISKFSWDKSDGVVGMPERKPMSILRRECASTTFYTVHYPFKEYRVDVKVSRTGNILRVESEKFVDTFDLLTRQYKRVVTK